MKDRIDKLNPYPGTIKRHVVEPSDKPWVPPHGPVSGAILPVFDDENVNCYLNSDFPRIATASRADLTKVVPEDNNRYPLVHAVLRQRDVGDGKEFYVEFEELVSVPTGSGLDYKCPHVSGVRDALMRFVQDKYASNKFKFKVDGKFYTLCDMSSTVLKSKYFMMPTL